MIYFSRYRLFYFVLLLAVIAGLSACQRAPQAYFAPTAHPAPQRLATTPASAPVTHPLVTASLTNVPEPTAKPIYERTTAAPPAEPAIRVEVGRPTVWHRVKRMMPGLPDHRRPVPPGCDQIVLRNGDVVDAKVKEVGVSEIRYKKCDRQDGPDYTISKRDVLSIKYSNGEVERFSASSTQSNNSSSGSRQSYNSPTNPQNDGPRTDPFAIVAISTGALAVLTGTGAFLLGAVAIVFGALSLSRIRKDPGRFKGKGLAVAGMVAGLVAAAFILIYYYL